VANRLDKEASPYLKQHAHNPVDWYPWGEEALAEAKKNDKPILLSIGYSACHWCHVMERESFEDEAIAKLMNEWFVNVKVDREERPDLDQIYQTVVQLMGRSGGWPLTVFLTPDQKPFFAGTYFPNTDRYGMPGFPKILQAVWEAYRTKREEVDAQANEVAGAIAEATDISTQTRGSSVVLGQDVLERAAKKLGARFDDTHGGFGARPKFPNTMSLDVLLRRANEDGDETARARVKHALDAMRDGGIYDQLGGGFHRYSTDERWLVPHFEKMLYDNALLLRLYADAARAFGEPRYAETAREIAAYVAREMTSPEHGFYATQDADSEGEEGKFFVWDAKEIEAALGGDVEAAQIAIARFGVTEEGNFEESGKTVLSIVDEIPVAAQEALARGKAKLFEAREKRIKPFRDEKVLASWNGLMIGALASAGFVDEAARAFAFIDAKLVLRDERGARVMRLTKDGVVKGPGFLDDYAFLADAAIDLYEATFEPDYIASARAFADAIVARFWDKDGVGFFFTPDDGEKLIHRAKDPYDHAIPSGTSIACRALLRLGAICDAKYLDLATKELERLAPLAVENPFGLSQSVATLDRLVRGSVDVVIVGAKNDARTNALARAAREAYVPRLNLALVDPNDPRSREACAALAEGKELKDGPVAHVCRGRVCSLPIAEVAELRSRLADRAARD
jgi:uncharacterized protein YyaL (SSP411 family)